MALGILKIVFLIRAVDVDVAVKGITAGPGVFSMFQATEPEDAGGHFVLGVFLAFAVELAGRSATLEDHSRRGVGADFLVYFMEPERGAQGILDAGGWIDAECCRVNFVAIPIDEVEKFFLANRNVNAMLRGLNGELLAAVFQAVIVLFFVRC